MIGAVARKLFGSSNDRLIRAYRPRVEQINALEGELESEIYGSYTVRLTAASRSYKLDCTPQEAYWRKNTLSGIAQALAGEDGLQASRIIEAAYQSARTGRVVAA